MLIVDFPLAAMQTVTWGTEYVDGTRRTLQFHIFLGTDGVLDAACDVECASTLELRMTFEVEGCLLGTRDIGQPVGCAVSQFNGDALATLNVDGGPAVGICQVESC